MEEIFDTNSLAQFLKVEPKTAEYMANMKRLPFFRVGRHIRFRRSAIEEWAKSNEVYPEKVLGDSLVSENRRARRTRNLSARQGVEGVSM